MWLNTFWDHCIVCIKLQIFLWLSTVAPAQILSLCLDFDVLGLTVKCIAQGKPLPQIQWTSSSGPLKNIPFKTYHSNYTVSSSVPFSDQAVYTCQAVNSLGQDQKAFPPNHPKSFILSVMTGILGCLLLLGLAAVILDVVKRSKYLIFCTFLIKNWCEQILMVCMCYFSPKGKHAQRVMLQ